VQVCVEERLGEVRCKILVINGANRSQVIFERVSAKQSLNGDVVCKKEKKLKKLNKESICSHTR
jgi:hypothetical protein